MNDAGPGLLYEPLPIAAPRIVVMGSTGSGKTSLARALAHRFQVPHVEMDALNWDPNWNSVAETDRELFRARVQAAVSGEDWVIDGNYSSARDLVWPRATALVWLDYPLRVVMWRLWWRTVRRAVTRQALWNGNRERFWTQFLSSNSLFVWLLKSHWRRRRTIPTALARPEHEHLRVFRHRSPRETAAWLAGLAVQPLDARQSERAG